VPVFSARQLRKYYRSRAISAAEISSASWRKSSFSNLNGSCVEAGRLSPDRIGVRDTKDRGEGPVLVFTAMEWAAFVAGIRDSQFDL
jgi:hypothetical protein